MTMEVVEVDEDFEELETRAVEHVRPERVEQRVERHIERNEVVRREQLARAGERARVAAADEQRLVRGEEIRRQPLRRRGRSGRRRQRAVR